MVTAAEALELGTRHHMAGRLVEAEQMYRQVLDLEPANADALHQLGTLATHVGRLSEGIALLRDAIRNNPASAAFHINLGEAYRRSGDLQGAITCNCEAIKLEPRMAGAYSNLGMLHEQRGDWAAAVECFEKLVELSPRDARARSLFGRALLHEQRTAEAEAQFRQAAQIAPREASTHYNLANALQLQNRFEEAAASYRAALALAPNHAETHGNLGVVLHKLHTLNEAESHYRQAIALDPNLVAAYNNLGSLLAECDRHEEAIACLRRATELSPQSPEVHMALGLTLLEAGSLDEAALSSRRAAELNPRAGAPYNSLGISAQTQGQLDEALEHYQTAVRLSPDSERFHSNYVYCLNYHPAYDAARIFAEHRTWAKKHADPLTATSPPHTNDPTSDRRLHVGYVSAHFCQHAVNHFVEPILASHDHTAFEVYCYASVIRPDETTRRLQGYADHWRDCLRETHDDVARMVRDDQIDILVDLSGHIGGERLQIFARKPAPVQVTYIGYQATTGMAAMDYRLTDDYSDPPGTDEFYTEKLVRLPRSFFCYRPTPDAPTVGPLPAIARGYVTFGSFNNFAKVTQHVLSAWARLLATVPNSRLSILSAATDGLRDRVGKIFEEHGVDRQRVEHFRRRPRAAYLELISQVDISLDPFPFNGHTTTCDALWQGVPVVTRSGATYASRFGGSGLVTLELDELIAATAEEYVEIAARLAADLDRLSALRAGLRERMAASPLLDFTGFTRNLEAAYRRMWADWCAAQKR